MIVPFAFDQSDNAKHANRLGTSRTVYRQKYFAARVARELDILLNDPSYAERARQISEKLKQENGAANAADLIEGHMQQINNRAEEPVYASGN